MSWQRVFENPTRRWHWVEDENDVVVFVGSAQDAKRYYLQNYRSRNLHLLNASADQGPRPVVGQVWDVKNNPTRAIDLGQDGKILIRTDDKWKDFTYGYDVPAKVLRSQFDWLDDAESSDHFFKYHGTWHHLSEFTRTAGGGAAGAGAPAFEAAGWQGILNTSFSTGILIKVSADGEQYKIATYRVTSG